MKDRIRIIQEWLIREEERFSWRKLGLYSNLDEQVAWLATNVPMEGEDESFESWKKRVIKVFYQRNNFKEFYEEVSNDRLVLKGIKSVLLAKLMDVFRREELTDTDRYIAPNGDTLSYSLSEEMFSSVVDNYLHDKKIASSLDINTQCSNAIKGLYPLEERFVIDKLEENDNFYWGKVYTRLRAVVDGFTYQMSGTSAKEELYDMWCDTCMTINDAVLNKKLHQPTIAKDIISYVVGIIKNKNRDHHKKISKTQPISLEKVEYKVDYRDDDNFFNKEVADPKSFNQKNDESELSQNKRVTNYIDLNDEVDVRNHLVLALYNENHPLHERLIKGYERQVQLLFEHYLDSLSYEEIVKKHYGEVSPKELVKHAARVRQDVKRVKSRLVARFISLVKGDKDE